MEEFLNALITDISSVPEMVPNTYSIYTYSMYENTMLVEM